MGEPLNDADSWKGYAAGTMERDDVYRDKAEECLAGAVSEYANGRYNNCANRCYYSCFQAAVAALQAAGINPPGSRSTWGHDQLQAAFAGDLINRRKVYSPSLRDVLPRVYLLREAADYKRERVSEIQASRAIQRALAFLNSVQPQGDAGA
jgi:uncharacterized protein (UPF0332 family)